MGMLDFIFKNRNTSSKKETEEQPEIVIPEVKEEYKGPETIAETNYSTVIKEKNGVFERLEFKIAGTSFHQPAIKKAIKEAKEHSFYFDEKYNGMSNKEILEETFDEPIFEFEGAPFTDCSLKLEPDNKYDPEAIAVYVGSFLVGYIPEKDFSEGKKYIYGQLTGGLKENQELNPSASLRGGKYKINRGDEKVEIGESDYKLDGYVTIKTNLE